MNRPTFTDKVYEIVREIPRGKVATYQLIATLAGSPGASRAVGTAMKHNPDMATIPCHRVVGTDGTMHGYAFGKGEITKEQLLRDEGVMFAGHKVDLATALWQ